MPLTTSLSYPKSSGKSRWTVKEPSNVRERIRTSNTYPLKIVPLPLDYTDKKGDCSPVRSKCYCSNGNNSSAKRYNVIEIYSRNPLPSRIPVHPHEWRCGESNPSVEQIVTSYEVIPELGFEPR